jgi:hypothetical protein
MGSTHIDSYIRRLFRWSGEESLYLLIISVIYLLFSFYNIFYYPIYIDESLTYEWFTSRGFVSSITYYPEPNNHVLFSLITNVFDYLPLPSLLKLRLPNLIIGYGSVLLTYRYLKNEFGHKKTVIPHCLFTFSYAITFYTVFARGYMLLIFSVLLGLIFLLKLIKEYDRKYVIAYGLCCIIGFCSHPLFLYAFVSFSIVLVINYQAFIIRQMRDIILSKLLVIVSTGIFYSPILYFNGLRSLTSNNAIEKRKLEGLDDFFANLFNNYDNIFGIKSRALIIALMLGVGLSWFLQKRFRKEVVIVIVMLISPYIFSLFQGVLLSPRYLLYLIFPITLGVAILLFVIQEHLKVNKVIIYLICLLGVLFQIHVFKTTNPKAAIHRDLAGLQLFNSIDFDKKDTMKAFFDFNSETAYEFFTLNYYLKSDKPQIKLDTILGTLNSKQFAEQDLLILNKKSNLKSDVLNNFTFVANIDSYLIYERSK